MRSIAAVVLFVVAGVSMAPTQSAFAQSWSMDHGHAADAAAAARSAAAAARAKDAAIAAGLPLSPSQSTNFSVNGSSVIHAVPALTAEQEQANEQARADWQARCHPTVIEDRDGLRRTKYAEPDCDLSSFNTAGK
jgi:hypothetical protein